MEFLVESIIQGLVSEAWEEEELWDLEENHLNQVLGFWEHLEQALEDSQVLAPGQVWGPFPQVPIQGQELWCPEEQRGLLRLIKLPPKPGRDLVELVAFLVVLELVVFLVVLELVASLVVLELAASLVVLVVLVASVA